MGLGDSFLEVLLSSLAETKLPRAKGPKGRSGTEKIYAANDNYEIKNLFENHEG
jgi:hypothetical protein